MLYHFYPGCPVVDALEGVPCGGPLEGQDACCTVLVSHEAAPPGGRLAATGPVGLRRGGRRGPPVIARARILGVLGTNEGSLIQIAGPLAGTQTDDFLANLERVQALRTDAWVELQVVLLPGRSDSDRLVDLLTGALHDHLGADVPLHLSAGGPDEGRGPVTLQQARWIAMSNGMRWVYTDDRADPSARCTWCPGCDALLIDHQGDKSRVVGLTDGRCSLCGWGVPGHFRCEALAA